MFKLFFSAIVTLWKFWN